MITKDRISLKDCESLAQDCKPRFVPSDPFGQLCNVLLTTARIFLVMAAKKMRDEANAPQDRGS